MVVQIGQVIKNPWIVQLKWLTFMVCKVYLDEAVKKKLKKEREMQALWLLPPYPQTY